MQVLKNSLDMFRIKPKTILAKQDKILYKIEHWNK